MGLVVSIPYWSVEIRTIPKRNTNNNNNNNNNINNNNNTLTTTKLVSAVLMPSRR